MIGPLTPFSPFAVLYGRRGSKTAPLFTPADLFANGEQGAWYDPSDLTTLYQDSAGTTPVTADGDPVGYMGDKSGNGNHATQATSANRPVYRTDGTLHWLEFDGVDDFLDIVGSTAAFNFLHDGTGGVSIFGVNRNSGTQSTVYSSTLDSSEVGATIYSQTSDVYRSTVSNGSGTFLILGNSDAVATGNDVITAIHDSSRASDYELFENQVSVFAQNHTGSPAAANATNDMRIGARGDGPPGLNMAGRIYSLIFAEGVPVTITETEQYVANKSGVTL